MSSYLNKECNYCTYLKLQKKYGDKVVLGPSNLIKKTPKWIAAIVNDKEVACFKEVGKSCSCD